LEFKKPMFLKTYNVERVYEAGGIYQI